MDCANLYNGLTISHDLGTTDRQIKSNKRKREQEITKVQEKSISCLVDSVVSLESVVPGNKRRKFKKKNVTTSPSEGKPEEIKAFELLLPEEIKALIFSFVNPRELLLLEQVCKSFRNRTESVWKEHRKYYGLSWSMCEGGEGCNKWNFWLSKAFIAYVLKFASPGYLQKDIIIARDIQRLYLDPLGNRFPSFRAYIYQDFYRYGSCCFSNDAKEVLDPQLLRSMTENYKNAISNKWSGDQLLQASFEARHLEFSLNGEENVLNKNSALSTTLQYFKNIIKNNVPFVSRLAFDLLNSNDLIAWKQESNEIKITDQSLDIVLDACRIGDYYGLEYVLDLNCQTSHELLTSMKYRNLPPILLKLAEIKSKKRHVDPKSEEELDIRPNIEDSAQILCEKAIKGYGKNIGAKSACRIAKLKMKFKEFESALFFYKEALLIHQRTARPYENWNEAIKIAHYLKRYRDVIYFYEESKIGKAASSMSILNSLEMAIKINLPNLLRISQAYITLKKYKDAEDCLHQAEDIFDKRDVINVIDDNIMGPTNFEVFFSYTYGGERHWAIAALHAKNLISYQRANLKYKLEKWHEAKASYGVVLDSREKEQAENLFQADKDMRLDSRKKLAYIELKLENWVAANQHYQSLEESESLLHEDCAFYAFVKVKLGEMEVAKVYYEMYISNAEEKPKNPSSKQKHRMDVVTFLEKELDENKMDCF